MRVTNDNAKMLAKEMIRIEDNILEIINNNQLNFDVYQDNEFGWIIQTSYCQMGGCVAGMIEVENEEIGKRLAAKMTYFEQKPSMDGLCSSCRLELYEMQI